MENPFLQPYTTPHGTVPFDKIELVHYEPAIREGISQEDKEINDIISNPEKPTFKNTILALEQSGKLLDQVTTVMFNLMSAETCNELDEIAEKMMPLLSEHSNNISLNEKLFERVKQVYEERKNLKLTPEELRLLEKTYDGFVRNGTNLSEEDKVTFRKISTELSSLTLRFSQNHLKETNSYELLLDSEEQLKGLPESIIEAAAHTAKEKGKNGWIITLQAPSYVPFMKYSENRELRRKLYMAYNTQCIHDNEQNNEDVVKQLVNLRMQLAQLLGFKNYADYALRKRMAENSERVYQLLDQLLEAYTPTAREEVKEIEALAQRTEGKDFQLMPWDFSYYAEKLKNEKFNLDEEALRPYFELSRVKEGVFGLATRLYGVSFKENKDIPVYHPDVQAYEVYDKDGSYLAVLYTDFHPRAGKRSGAWMTSYKEQWIEANGTNSRPHVSVTMNFTKPTANKPALLTFSEVNTFLHEFGHALHGIFANTRFKSMSGTNVYWDFVELPSQIMENFAIEKDFLNTFARHYQTNESIPEELLQRIIDASNWNYPDTLRYYTGMDVYNLGVCGETSYEIALRQGGIKMYVGKQVTVKPGKRTQISIVDESGNPVILENFNGYETDNQQPENVVYINDIPFKLEYDNSRIYISIYDNAVDKSVKLKKGSQIITKAAHDIAGDVLVIQMGSNGGWNDYDELIEQYKAMIANSGTECYIIIGDTDNPEESVDSANYTSSQEIGTDDSMWEAALREDFGEHFINMKTYLLENALNIAGLEPTQLDEEDLSQGRVPETIKYDYTHLNSYGYYAIGYGVYEKGLELGYW